MDLVEHLRQRCRAAPGHLAFPDSDDGRILAVADRMLAEGTLASATFLTPKLATLATAARDGVKLERHGDRIRWAPPEGTANAARLAAAAELLARGDADAVLGGNIATTAEVIRAGIGGVGLAAGVRTVSGSFIMHRPDGATYLFADCGVVIAPTVRQLVDIGSESVKTWRQLFPDVPPVVAFLSFSTKGSAVHEAQARIVEAFGLFKAQCPDVIADGELQFDAAFDAAIGRRKAPGSPVPGRTNCFIFPSLDAGNIAYKIAQRLGGFQAYGPVLQGLAKPFNDLSRGATVDDVLASAYITLARRALSAPSSAQS
jgi:phosphate acetyltransferase